MWGMVSALVCGPTIIRGPIHPAQIVGVSYCSDGCKLQRLMSGFVCLSCILIGEVQYLTFALGV